MKLKEIEKSLRPREKMIESGAVSLTDTELLAIILSSGTKNESVIDLSKRLINTYGLKRLFLMDYNELKTISGIKEAKASKLMAIFELVRRVNSKENNYYKIYNHKSLYQFVKNDYLYYNKEMIIVIYVNKTMQVLSKRKYEEDYVTKVAIPFKKIVKEAINTEAYGIFLVHNHPSGDVRPSASDIESTSYLMDTLRPLDICLLDHIIVGKDKYYSIGAGKSFESNGVS